MVRRRRSTLAWSGPAAGLVFALASASSLARNAVIFVADGLRSAAVNAEVAPTLSSVAKRGVFFANSHSLFPTFTTPNASAIATGHYLGDTGDFSNSLFIGFPIFDDGTFSAESSRSYTPFIEDDAVLGDLDAHFPGGRFLGADGLLTIARASGYSTAAIGKLGPVAIQDVVELNPQSGRLVPGGTIIIDDLTGSPNGVPLDETVLAALKAAGLASAVPVRQQPQGSVTIPGTTRPNLVQQHYFADATTLAVLPLFKAAGKPFVLVYWSRDPDGSQHNQGDSLNRLVPGINGPTSRLGIANADANLRQILDYIASDSALARDTDIFVTADHGFATISKHELDASGDVTHGYSTQFKYLDRNGRPDVIAGWLPPGFLAIDLAHALELPLFDPDTLVDRDGVKAYAAVDPAATDPSRLQHSSRGHGLLGGTGAVLGRTDAKVIVAANGGSDLIYVPDGDAATVRRIVDFLAHQDYTGALFVDSSFGTLPGALSLAAIGLEGSARLPRPSIVVAFRTFVTDPAHALTTGVQIADTPLQEGQGMHGSFARDNTFNFMAAMGPDFRRASVDETPVSNADIAVTLARVLGLTLPAQGKLQGRVLREALAGASGTGGVAAHAAIEVSTPDAAGLRTVLNYQQIGSQRYFDAACRVVKATACEPQRVAKPDDSVQSHSHGRAASPE
jgi:arylsulfatase A-like enzyme